MSTVGACKWPICSVHLTLSLFNIALSLIRSLGYPAPPQIREDPLVHMSGGPWNLQSVLADWSLLQVLRVEELLVRKKKKPKNTDIDHQDISLLKYLCSKESSAFIGLLKFLELGPRYATGSVVHLLIIVESSRYLVALSFFSYKY